MATLRVDESPEDAAYLKSYTDKVDRLCGLVTEMVGDNPATLLSPYFRETLLDQARGLHDQHRKIAPRLHVDNPGKPLDDDGSGKSRG